MKIIFAGTPDFSVPALDMLLSSRHKVIAVYTQPDRPAGRGRKLRASPVKQRALENSIPVYQPTTLKNEQEQSLLASLQPDLMIVVAYGLILPSEVLNSPKYGCINIHASLLPRWRGAAPIQRSILSGDKETGITIMQMDKGLDTGDILAKNHCQIAPGDTAQTLHDKLAQSGAELMLETIEQIVSGTLKPESQNEQFSNYAKKIEKNEAILDWTLPAQTLEYKIRAFNSWPVAQTVLAGKVLRIWQAKVLVDDDDDIDRDKANAVPGVVIKADKKGIDVATGKGILRLLQVQLPGGKSISAHAFINAHSVTGEVLGACRT